MFKLLNGAWDSIFTSEIFTNSSSIKKFTLSQTISVSSTSASPQIGLEIDNAELKEANENPASILKRSGCIRVLNEGVPIVKWVEGTGAPTIENITAFKITYYIQ